MDPTQPCWDWSAVGCLVLVHRVLKIGRQVDYRNGISHQLREAFPLDFLGRQLYTLKVNLGLKNNNRNAPNPNSSECLNE